MGSSETVSLCHLHLISKLLYSKSDSLPYLLNLTTPTREARPLGSLGCEIKTFNLTLCESHFYELYGLNARKRRKRKFLPSNQVLHTFYRCILVYSVVINCCHTGEANTRFLMSGFNVTFSNISVTHVTAHRCAGRR